MCTMGMVISDQRPVDALEAVVSLLEKSGRRPDRWEAYYVLSAVRQIERDNDSAARRQSALAQLPPELRPPSQFNRIPRVFGLLTSLHLRLALDGLTMPTLPRRQRRPARRRVSRDG